MIDNPFILLCFINTKLRDCYCGLDKLCEELDLSKEILKSAGIALNEFLEVSVSNGVITLVKPNRHKTLEERAAEYDGKLMLDGEYDWGEPVGREVW